MAHKMKSKPNIDPSSSSPNRIPRTLQFLVLGQRSTGKTSLIKKLTTDQKFNKMEPSSTVYEHFRIDAQTKNSQGPIKVTITVASGHQNVESDKNLVAYAKDAHAIMFVYSVSRGEEMTFDKIFDTILPLIEKQVMPSCKMILLANKCDVGTDYEFSSQKDIALKKGWLFQYTSAKDEESIGKAFRMLLGEVVDKFEDGGKNDKNISPSSPSSNGGGVVPIAVKSAPSKRCPLS